MKAHFPLYVFTNPKRIPDFAPLPYPLRDPLVIKSSQIGPSSSTPHNSATVTPIVVKPTLTSSYRRALSFGNIFTRCSRRENDYFSLSSNQPPLRKNHPTFRSAASPHFFLESPSPHASHNTHLHDSHAVAMVFNLNIY